MQIRQPVQGQSDAKFVRDSQIDLLDPLLLYELADGDHHGATPLDPVVEHDGHPLAPEVAPNLADLGLLGLRAVPGGHRRTHMH